MCSNGIECHVNVTLSVPGSKYRNNTKSLYTSTYIVYTNRIYVLLLINRIGVENE